MSSYDASRILKPSFFRINHIRQGSPNRIPYVIGFDSEAENGVPFLYQFAKPDGSCDLITLPKRGKKFHTLFAFLEWLRVNCTRKDTEYIIFGFNLAYEYTQLFRDLNAAAIRSSEFQLGTVEEPSISRPSGTPFVLRALNEKRYAFTVEFGNGHRTIKVIDAHAFFPTSLDAAAKSIGAGKKHPKPKSFSRKSSHTPEFIAYATQDAVLTQKLGEYIVDLHRTYDVSMSATAPHFASKTFRRQFLQSEVELAHPNLEQFGLDSYHGGKNGFYLDRPEQLEGMYHVDIRSAYPEAMSKLPDIERSTWRYTEEYEPNVHAVWEIEGTYKPCVYRCLMGKTTWIGNGRVTSRVTSYELDQVLAHGEFTLDKCVGYVLEGPSGGALADYVSTFYSLKRNAKSPAERVAAKLFLNSLYGKFFQKVALGKVGTVNIETGRYIESDPEQDFDYVAGGLYHPAIASLITGFVRAKIHGLEHKYESVMTSTDGFFSRKPPPEEEIGNELGQLDAERGTLRIWRERLYVFTPDDSSHSEIAALHGWRGSIAQLKRVPLVAGNLYHYHAKAMVTLKMSLQQLDGAFHPPGKFINRKFVLNLAESSGLEGT